MKPTPEDKRAAVGLSTNLSGQLVQSAVAMLTVEGAYIAYALVSRETHSSFGLVAILAATAFAMSVYFSGRGITEARNAGYLGNWNLTAGRSFFNLQAICLMVGLALLGTLILLSGSSKESETDKRLNEISTVVSQLKAESEMCKRESERQMQALSLKLEEMRTRERPSSQTEARNGGKRVMNCKSAP